LSTRDSLKITREPNRFPTQIANGTKYADRMGWDVVRVFKDEGRSGYTGEHRPGFEEMINFLSNGDIPVLIAWPAIIDDATHDRLVGLRMTRVGVARISAGPVSTRSSVWSTARRAAGR
jgi:Resolvase, N terminal domain